MFQLMSENANLDVSEALATFAHLKCDSFDAQELTEIAQCIFAQRVYCVMYDCDDETRFYAIDIYSLCEHVFDSRDLHDVLKDEKTKVVASYRSDNISDIHEILCTLSYNINVLQH